MRHFQQLQQELCEERPGVFAPWHFRAAGYRKALNACAQCPPLTKAQLQALEEQYGRCFAVSVE